MSKSRRRRRQLGSRRGRAPAERGEWPNASEVVQWYRTAINGADLLRHEHGVDPGVLGAAWFMAGLAILKTRYSRGGGSGALNAPIGPGAKASEKRPRESR